MFRWIRRELYLLPRGEQRALILISLLLILGIVVRVVVQLIPGRDPPGMDRFVEESRSLLAEMAKMDSLEGVREPGGVSDTGSHYTSGNRYPVQYTTVFREPEPISINSADSTQLLPLPGIGPVFAGRIIKYRNLLGGFISADQLGEVYGLSGETIERILPYLVIDSASVQKLDLNSAAFGELLRHPYLQFEDVQALANYRDFRGKITSVQELLDNHLLPDSVLLRVGPYLTAGSE